jgi:hypothetical protein
METNDFLKTAIEEIDQLRIELLKSGCNKLDLKCYNIQQTIFKAMDAHEVQNLAYFKRKTIESFIDVENIHPEYLTGIQELVNYLVSLPTHTTYLNRKP